MFFNEIRDLFTPSDIGKQPSNKDMKEIKRCYPQIVALSGSEHGMISKLKGRDHAYVVGSARFHIVNGDTVVPE